MPTGLYFTASRIGSSLWRCSAVGMDIEQMCPPESPTRTVPDRLRWTSDFLDLASKAIGIIACAHGIDCSPELYRTAQRDLRAWARYLESHPSLAAELELASQVSVTAR
jgi:hypothetical protein